MIIRHHPQTAAYDDCLTRACADLAEATAASTGFRRLATRGWTSAVSDAELVNAAEAAERIARDEAADPANGIAFENDELLERGTMAMVTPDTESPLRYGTSGAMGVTVLTGMRLLLFLEWLPTEAEWKSDENLLAKMQHCAARVCGEVHHAIVDLRGARYLRETVLDSPPAKLDILHDADAVLTRLTAVIACTFGPGSAATGRAG
ncbi:MAG: hypothetical protein AAF805_00105 [Planctomycetota bacterium]